ncbi:MAG: pantoate kinase [Candidatus Njordarchaeum guaymaensis]
MRKVKVIVPGGISAIFEPNLTSDPLTTGARGAGIAIENTVEAEVILEEYNGDLWFFNKINGCETNSGIGKIAAKIALEKRGLLNKIRVTVNQIIRAPIASGFGTSAASALAIILGIYHALGKKISLLEAGKLAHIAELEAKTGLGTVSGLLSPGGIIIVAKPGAPGISIIDKIPLNKHLYVIAVSLGKKETQKALKDPNLILRAKKYGKKYVDLLLSEPSIENFFQYAFEFSTAVGLMTPTLANAIKAAVHSGAIGAAQTMIGDAVFALAEENMVQQVRQALEKSLGEKGYVFRPVLDGFEVFSNKS